MNANESPLASRACSNCGRVESHPAVRICPNCGAVMPFQGRVNAGGAGFAALAQQLPPREETPVTERASPSVEPGTEPAESGAELSQPWAMAPVLKQADAATAAPDEDDRSGPYLTKSLRGDRALGFAGEVAAVALGFGVLIAVGECADNRSLPDWAPAAVLIGGIGLFALCLWGAKGMRESYPQLARGWYSGRAAWLNTLLSLAIGALVLGLILLILGPLGLFAVCLGSVIIMTLGPMAWLLLALIFYVIGRSILFAVYQKYRRR